MNDVDVFKRIGYKYKWFDLIIYRIVRIELYSIDVKLVRDKKNIKYG